MSGRLLGEISGSLHFRSAYCRNFLNKIIFPLFFSILKRHEVDERIFEDNIFLNEKFAKKEIDLQVAFSLMNFLTLENSFVLCEDRKAGRQVNFLSRITICNAPTQFVKARGSTAAGWVRSGIVRYLIHCNPLSSRKDEKLTGKDQEEFGTWSLRYQSAILWREDWARQIARRKDLLIAFYNFCDQMRNISTTWSLTTRQ